MVLICAVCFGQLPTVILRTQAEVDNYPLQYSNADSIYSLKIGYDFYEGETSKTKNLDSLYAIKYVSRELRIEYNDSLVSLAGLENLSLVGRHIWISNNKSLASLDGLSGLDSVGAFISIYKNQVLTSCATDLICQILIDHPTDIYSLENGIGCSGPDEIASSCGVAFDCPPGITFSSQTKIDQFPALYPGCREIPGNVYIFGESSPVMKLDSLLNIKLIGGDLNIWNNHALLNLSGLDSLTMIEGRFDLNNNDGLKTLNGLDNLHYCGTGLNITNNDSLENLMGLESIVRVGGNLDVNSNKRIKTLVGLSNVRFCSGLSVRLNDSLTEFNGLNKLDSTQYSLQVFSNPLLTEFNGLNHSKHIGCDPSTDINSLAGLDSLRTVGKELRIYESGLNDFTELPLIDSIGALYVRGCDSLRNFRGLEKIEHIAGRVYCEYSDSLSDFEGLESLKSLGIMDLRTNNNLFNFLGLDSLVRIEQEFYISFNANFQSFSGLNSLTSIGGDLTVRVSNSFNSFVGLDSLKMIGGDFEMNFTGPITNFNHLANLHEIHGDMTVRLTSVRDFTGLDSLEYIGGSLVVKDNQSLTSFAGLNELYVIGKNFSIVNNDSLICMDGLPKLDSIGEELGIGVNDRLTKIVGLEELKYISTLNLQLNPQLSACSITSFCNFINVNVPPSYYISDNSTGCNSDLEILAACKSCPCVLTQENAWTGIANDGRWHNQFNWSQQSIPDPCDLVEIEIAGAPIVLEQNRTAECFTLSIAEGITLVQEQGSVLVVKCADQ
ncbi:MAG: hypothetical protein IPL46_14335 [Saprospiraceae bacterium]|nr:hypothetical protein [Saprospiraceae bacterium]